MRIAGGQRTAIESEKKVGKERKEFWEMRQLREGEWIIQMVQGGVFVGCTRTEERNQTDVEETGGTEAQEASSAAT